MLVSPASRSAWFSGSESAGDSLHSPPGANFLVWRPIAPEAKSGAVAAAWRLATALLASIAMHAFVILNVKPVSAEYAGIKPIHEQATRPRGMSAHFLPLQLVSDVSLPASAPNATDVPRPDGQADPKLRKEYLERRDPRAGNLPDGRNAWWELDIPVANRYYTAREVDRRANPLAEIAPVYPPAGLSGGISGKVVLLLLIGETGSVDGVQILEARPKGMFDDSARAAFSAAKFTPAMKDGRAVKSQKIVEVTFEPSE